jgi:hypothetical protein
MAPAAAAGCCQLHAVLLLYVGLRQCCKAAAAGLLRVLRMVKLMLHAMHMLQLLLLLVSADPQSCAET